MIDDELALAGEQLGESLCSLRRVEDIWLLHLHPGQSTTLGAQRVACLRELLLLSEQVFARCKPLFLRDDFMRLHDELHGWGRAQQLSADRSHPADTGAAGLAQNGDTADTRNVEER